MVAAVLLSFPLACIALRAISRVGVCVVAACLFAMAGSACAVDVNTATAAQLESVRGIGPKTAARLVQERQQHGAFSSYDDLADRVSGMGAKRLDKLKRGGLRLGAAVASAPGGKAAAAPDARPAHVIVNTPTPHKGKGN